MQANSHRKWDCRRRNRLDDELRERRGCTWVKTTACTIHARSRAIASAVFRGLGRLCCCVKRVDRGCGMVCGHACRGDLPWKLIIARYDGWLDPCRKVRTEWFAVVRISSKIGVDGYWEAALKLLTLVLLLVGKRTLGPKTAKLRQPRRPESPSTLSNRQAGTAVTSGAAHRERANGSEATSTGHSGLLRNRVFQPRQNGPGSTFLVCRWRAFAVSDDSASQQ